MSVPSAVLDADVIFSRVLHELMGRLAAGARLFDLVWSEELLGEAESSLIDREGLASGVAETWVGHMRREFPGGRLPRRLLGQGAGMGREPYRTLLADLIGRAPAARPRSSSICAAS
ncbi:MAG: hypothetical protein H0X42_04290 [Solirubrobacterales bacterium]|nr:hypothetical protein [Solirubrobacterales bacterium]